MAYLSLTFFLPDRTTDANCFTFFQYNLPVLLENVIKIYQFYGPILWTARMSNYTAWDYFVTKMKSLVYATEANGKLA